MFRDTRGTLDTPVSPTPDILDTSVSPTLRRVATATAHCIPIDPQKHAMAWVPPCIDRALNAGVRACVRGVPGVALNLSNEQQEHGASGRRRHGTLRKRRVATRKHFLDDARTAQVCRCERVVWCE